MLPKSACSNQTNDKQKRLVAVVMYKLAYDDALVDPRDFRRFNVLMGWQQKLLALGLSDDEIRELEAK